MSSISENKFVGAPRKSEEPTTCILTEISRTGGLSNHARHSNDFSTVLVLPFADIHTNCNLAGWTYLSINYFHISGKNKILKLS
jgi:hypothetical protein